MLAPERRLNGLYRTVLFVPWAVPTVIAALNWRWVYDEFSGMLNTVLLALGLTQNVVAWLAEPRLAMWCVIAVAVWTGTPFYTMSFLAGLQAIPKELYEAASVDGASAWQKFRYVTWPSIRTLYVTSTLLSLIWTLGDFNSVYLLTGGQPADRTHVLATLGIRYIRLDQLDHAMATIVVALPFVLPLVYFMMKRLSGDEQKSS